MATENNQNFPWEIKDVDLKTMEERLKNFSGDNDGFVHVGPKKYFLPHIYKHVANDIYNLPLRPDDVFVVTYPRISFWSSFKSDRKVKLPDIATKLGTQHVDAAPSPRFIKTHLPLSLLPLKLLETAKVVYVARDPRDVAVSFCHLAKSMGTYKGDFKTYWHYFIRNLLLWSPFFEHIKDAWEKRHHPNLLILFYEELSKDLPSAVRRVAAFFNKELSEDQVTKLCDHLAIDNFKKNKSVNNNLQERGLDVDPSQGIIRKGKAGGWRDYFDADMTREADKWIADNLKDTDFRFPHLAT